RPQGRVPGPTPPKPNQPEKPGAERAAPDGPDHESSLSIIASRPRSTLQTSSMNSPRKSAGAARVLTGRRLPPGQRPLPSKRLDTFANPTAGRDFQIHMRAPEFTCLCPLTGQPDFAGLLIEYVPDQLCVELK